MCSSPHYTMTGQEHYKVLGITRSASENDIKKAYHQLAKKFHPDKNQASDAEEKFKEIGAAYEVLKDGQKRRVYDMQKDGEAEKARHKQNKTTSNGSTSSGFSFQKPSGFNFKSTFSSFNDDEFFKRAREEFENMSGKNVPKKGKKKKTSKPSNAQRRTNDFTRPEWHHDFQEEEVPKPNKNRPKFTFEGFTFMEEPFTEFDNVFDDFFRDPFFKPPFGGDMRGGTSDRSKSQQRASFPATSGDNDHIRIPRKEKTTPNTRKKEEEDEMYDWSKPVFGYKNYDSDSEYDYDMSDESGRLLFNCQYCGRRFSPNILRKHEQVCEKWQHRNQKTPTSDDGREPFRVVDSPNQEPKRTDWREEHDKLVNNIRLQKMAQKTRLERESHRRSPSPLLEEDITDCFMECRYCHRMFSEDAAIRHIPFCERRTATHGAPVSHTTNPGGSTSRAKEYAKNIPKPTPSRPTKPAGSSSFSTKPPAGGQTSTPRHTDRPSTARATSTPRPTTASTPRAAPSPRTGASYTPSTPKAEAATGRHGNFGASSGVTGASFSTRPPAKPAYNSARPSSAARSTTGASTRESLYDPVGAYGASSSSYHGTGTSASRLTGFRNGVTTGTTTPRTPRTTTGLGGTSTGGYSGISGTSLGGSSGRSYMDNPMTFTGSGLHAHPTGGSTRASRSTVRTGLGASSTSSRNVNFTIPRTNGETTRG